MPIKELETFRQKYPQYNDIDDATLANKLASKYPEYSDLLDKVKSIESKTMASFPSYQKAVTLPGQILAGAGEAALPVGRLAMRGVLQTLGFPQQIAQPLTEAYIERGREAVEAMPQPRDIEERIARGVGSFLPFSKFVAPFEMGAAKLLPKAPGLVKSLATGVGYGATEALAEGKPEQMLTRGAQTAGTFGVYKLGGKLGELLPRRFAPVGSVAGGAIAGAAVSPEDRVEGAIFGGGLGAMYPAQGRYATLEKTVNPVFNKYIRPSIKGEKTPARVKSYYTDAQNVVQDIITNKENLANVEGSKLGVPKNLSEFSQAIASRKQDLYTKWSQLERQAIEGGATPDISSAVNSIRNEFLTRAYNIRPEIQNYAYNLITSLQSTKPTIDVLSKQIKILNDTASKSFGDPNAINRSKVDALVAAELRKVVDKTIEQSSGPGWQQLRSRYKAYKTVEKDVNNAVMREAKRINPQGLSSLLQTYGSAETVAGLITANPALIGRGLAVKGLSTLSNWLYNPDRNVKNMFVNVEKLMPKKTITAQAQQKQQQQLPAQPQTLNFPPFGTIPLSAPKTIYGEGFTAREPMLGGEQKLLNAPTPQLQLPPSKILYGEGFTVGAERPYTPESAIGQEFLKQKWQEFGKFKSLGSAGAGFAGGGTPLQFGKSFQVKDVHGQSKTIHPEPEMFATQVGKNWQIHDGQEVTVRPGIAQDIINRYKIPVKGEFAPELSQVEEVVKGKEEDVIYKTTGNPKYPYGKYNKEGKLLAQATHPFEGIEGTKFSQHQLPGGENYREVLIKAPKEKIPNVPEIIWKEEKNGDFNTTINGHSVTITPEGSKFYVYEKGGQLGQTQPTLGQAKIVAQRYFERTIPKPQGFRSSHWDEPNVLAHLRMNDRTTPDGKKVLFIEELQSDWAREARTKGFSPEKQARITELENGTNLTPREMAELTRLVADKKLATPTNPLLKNWQELALKRAVKEAVEKGYDYISWTTGEQQAARYDLSNAVSAIKWQHHGKDAYVTLEGLKGISDQDIEIKVDRETGIIKVVDLGAPRDWTGKKLSDAIGKGISDRIIAEEKGDLQGANLKIGGEWAKNLYDKQVPNILKDLTKGNVENIQIPVSQYVKEGEIDRTRPVTGKYFPKQENLITQPALKITPEIKARILGKGAVSRGTAKGGEIDVKYSNIQDLNDFKSEWAKIEKSGLLNEDAVNIGKGKKFELARRTMSVFGGNDLTPQANRSLKDIKFILESSPDLIRLVPEKDMGIVLEYIKQNNTPLYPTLKEIVDNSKLSPKGGQFGKFKGAK